MGTFATSANKQEAEKHKSLFRAHLCNPMMVLFFFFKYIIFLTYVRNISPGTSGLTLHRISCDVGSCPWGTCALGAGSVTLTRTRSDTAQQNLRRLKSCHYWGEDGGDIRAPRYLRSHVKTHRAHGGQKHVFTDGTLARNGRNRTPGRKTTSKSCGSIASLEAVQRLSTGTGTCRPWWLMYFDQLKADEASLHSATRQMTTSSWVHWPKVPRSMAAKTGGVRRTLKAHRSPRRRTDGCLKSWRSSGRELYVPFSSAEVGGGGGVLHLWLIYFFFLQALTLDLVF